LLINTVKHGKSTKTFVVVRKLEKIPAEAAKIGKSKQICDKN
jgi:hypothetical protein